MPGIWDWYYNSLKADQSPATNQLPRPPAGRGMTPLPVPFQIMPGESTSALSPVTNMFNQYQLPPETQAMANTPMMPPTGAAPGAPASPNAGGAMDSIRKIILANAMASMNKQGQAPAQQKPEMMTMERLGNPFGTEFPNTFQPMQTKRPSIDERLKALQQGTDQQMGLLSQQGMM